MKRVLVVIPSFEIGGTVVSLRSLLSNINQERVIVDVFARDNIGPFITELPNCTILGENIWLSSHIHYQSFFKKVLFTVLKRVRNIFSLFHINLYGIYSLFGGREIRSMDYDSVISFQEDLNRIVCFYPAKRRIAWIHCDYQRYLLQLKKGDEQKFYEKYNTIVAVSQFAKDIFCRVFPQFENKTIFLYNIIDVGYIYKKSRSQEILDDRFDAKTFSIISVGRLDPVKQFEMIPMIASMVKSLTDIPFKWYIIGGIQRTSPNEETTIISNIRKYDVQENVFLLGEKYNIYPYMLHSNLLVHTSESESFSLVVHEAMALHLPIIMNNIPVANEIINDGHDGFISPIEGMPQIILKILTKQFKFEPRQFSPATTIEGFLSII